MSSKDKKLSKGSEVVQHKSIVSKINQSQVLLGCLLCLSGFNEVEYVKVAKLTAFLGAQLESTCSPRISCLIAKYMGASLCEQAIKYEVPIVGVQYLHDIQATQQLLPIERYLLPPLYRLNICCTGLSSEQRKRIQQQVDSLGGKFSAELVRDQSTHLIATQAQGSKYQHARSWGNVKIINTSWLDDCERLQRWCPEKAYLDEQENATIPLSHDTISQALFTETQKTGTADIGNVSLNILADDFSQPVKPIESQKMRQLSIAALLEEADRFLVNQVGIHQLPAIPSISSYRHGCLHRQQVFITGYPPEVRDYMVRCVLHVSGHVTMVVTASTGYIALGPYASDMVRRQLSQHPCSPEPISLLWLLETLFEQELWRPLLREWHPSG